MKRFGGLGALLAAAACAAPAFAQSSAYTLQQRGMNETLRLDVGASFQTFSSAARLDASGGAPGTDLGLESGLGLPDSKTTLRADGTLRLGRRMSLQFGYRTADRAGSAVIARDVTWGDQTYRASARVDTRMKVDLAELYVAWALVNAGDTEFAVMVGATGAFAKASLSAAGAGSEERSVSAPLPAVGAFLRYALYPRVFAWARVKGLTATVSGTHGSYLDWSAGADFFFSKNFGIGGGYGFTKVDVDHRKDRTYAISYETKGPLAYVSIAF